MPSLRNDAATLLGHSGTATGHRQRAIAGETMPPLLTAHFLGSFRVTVDGNLVDTATRRRSREVLAYLLAHRRSAVPTDVLMEAFWPGAEPGAARNSLHVALSGVRQALRAAWPEPVLERRFNAYRVADSVSIWIDAEQFERDCDAALRADRAGDHDTAVRCYEAACALYEGDFLADEPYVEWTAGTRETLRLRAVETQRRLAEIYMERDDYGPATVLSRRTLAIDPCNEQVHRQLMNCYAATGHRHLALSQYHRLAATLWETFRVRPSAETVMLHEWLRRPHGIERRPA